MSASLGSPQGEQYRKHLQKTPKKTGKQKQSIKEFAHTSWKTEIPKRVNILNIIMFIMLYFCYRYCHHHHYIQNYK